MGANANSRSTTWSTRVPLWLAEEAEKIREPGETNSALVVRALVLLVTKGNDADEG